MDSIPYNSIAGWSFRRRVVLQKTINNNILELFLVLTKWTIQANETDDSNSRILLSTIFPGSVTVICRRCSSFKCGSATLCCNNDKH